MATIQSFLNEWSKPKYSTKGGANWVRETTNPPPPPMVPNPSSGPPPSLHLFDNTVEFSQNVFILKSVFFFSICFLLIVLAFPFMFLQNSFFIQKTPQPRVRSTCTAFIATSFSLGFFVLAHLLFYYFLSIAQHKQTSLVDSCSHRNNLQTYNLLSNLLYHSEFAPFHNSRVSLPAAISFSKSVARRREECAREREMDKEMQNSSLRIEHGPEGSGGGGIRKNLDDDGRQKRTGTWITASAHIITAVIGSGVLSLAWAIAQLGWVVGPLVLVVFSFITFFTSTLLADSYRSPDPITGNRNYTYMDAVRAHLGGRKVQLCGLAQYVNLIGITIGYTITASISMVAVRRSNCFHKHGHAVKCQTSNNPYMIIFACIQIMLSQIPNFHRLSWLSILAAVMSFAYATIGLGLSLAKVIGGAHARTSLTGVTVGVDVSAEQKVWRTFQALGDIAFAYAYSTVLIEIQDTLKSGPPENKAMKRASFVGILTTTTFYILCGCLGYAAFGNDAPGNFLTGFGFYEPFVLVDLANVCIAIHLIGAYQVFCQPIFSFVESRCHKRWPDSKFITTEHAINIPFYGVYYLNVFRLVWRTSYVIVTAVLAMLLPFFNDFLALLGAISFWPLTVYFPIEMYMARSKMPKYSFTWTSLKVLSWACLVISLVSAAGSIEGLIRALKTYKPFKAQQ